MTTVELATGLIRSAANHLGIHPLEIISKDRSTATVEARWACWLVMRENGYTLAEIGRAFRRDHTSVVHGLARAKEHQGHREELFRRLCQVVKDFLNHPQTS